MRREQASQKPSRSLVGRQTRPVYRDGLTSNRSKVISAGGLGAIPLSLGGEDMYWLQCISRKGINGIRECYRTDWRRLLRLLVYLHELGGLALENDTNFCAPADDEAALPVAYRPDGKVDDDATEELKTLFDAYPHGGLPGLVASLVAGADTDGFVVVEAVPLSDMSGVGDIFVADGLSCRYAETTEGVRRLQQRDATAGKTGGWRDLDESTVFAHGWRSSDNNPNGLPRFTRFLRVGLPDIWEQLMLSDWVQGQAYGRIAGEMDLEPLTNAINQSQVNGENPFLKDADGNEISALDAIMSIIADTKADFENLESSDSLFGAGIKYKAVNPGGSGIKDAFDIRGGRIYAALHQPPVLMYSRSGGALSTSSSEELRAHQGVLGGVRKFAFWFLMQIGNLHLRLRGHDAICRIHARPISITSGLEEARADRMRLGNAGTRVLMGFTSGETEATEITGTGMEDPAQHETWRQAQTDKPMPSDGGGSSTGNSNQ